MRLHKWLGKVALERITSGLTADAVEICLNPRMCLLACFMFVQWTIDYIMHSACLQLNISFVPLSSGHLMYKEMSSPDSLLSNMSILLIKSMLSYCVQNGGPIKENQ